MSEKSNKDWERPWTTEEIVERADNWSLACDSALLNTLKAFGDRILKRAEDVNEKIENLNENLEKVHLQVDLARNEFSSLRNTQFVECRVYDDDETILSEKPKQEETNVPEEETIEDFKSAVALGLNILDEYYDRVKVTVSDSEDDEEEEVESSYIFRRKDPYINRRLPLVIGSEEWHKKWHVGLIDTDSENENSEKLSDTESEDNFSQNNDCSDVTSELSDLSGFKGSSKVQPVRTTIADTTNPNVTTTTNTLKTSSDQTPQASFAEQLAAKLGNVIREKENVFEGSEVNKRPIQKKPSDYGALFSNEPPPLDDIKVQERQGSYAKNKGLFDEDDDENDFWTSSKNTDDAIPKQIKEISSNKSQQVSSKSELDSGKGLFDDDSDDDIFSSSKTEQRKQPYLQPKKPIMPVFEEDPPVFNEETENKEKKKPLGGVSLFGTTDILKDKAIGKILKQRKVSSSSDEDETDSPNEKDVKTAEKSVASPFEKSAEPAISTVPETVEPEKKKSLFDEDIFGDDLFSASVKKNISSSILFSDEETPDLFSSNSSKKANKDLTSNSDISDTEYSFKKNSKSNITSLFDETAEEDSDIFNVKKDGSKESEANKSTGEMKKKTVGLFDDLDETDDLFWGVPKKTDAEKAKKTVSLLFEDDEDDDFSIFKPKNENTKLDSAKEQIANKKEEKPSNKEQNTNKPKISLFDDDLGDVNDIFSPSSTKKDTKKDSLENNRTGSNKEENYKTEKNSGKQTNEVDIKDVLNEQKPFVENTEKNDGNKIEETKTEEQIVRKPKVSLFDDDLLDVDDIFSQSLKEKGASKRPSPLNEQSTSSETNKKENSKILEPKNETDNSKSGNWETDKNLEETNEINKLIDEKNIIEEPNTGDQTTGNREFSIFNDDLEDIFSETVKEEDTTRNISEKSSLLNENNTGVSVEPEISNKPKISKRPVIQVDTTNETITEKPKTEKTSTDNDETKNKEKTEKEDLSEEEMNKSDNHHKSEHPTTLNVDKTEDSPSTVANLKDKYESSPSVLNVKFMDTIPPPDDDWDTYSDNTFDDMEQTNDGFESRPSSLFDNEPPSLFFNDNSSRGETEGLFTVITDREQTRDEEKAVGLNPGNQSQKEDAKTSNKPPKPEKKPKEIQETLPADLTGGRLDSLFENLDEDQTDFLFSNLSDKGGVQIRENFISDDKIGVSDKLDESKIETDEPVVGVLGEDDMQNNITKITERLQQISNRNEERTKPLAAPGKLSHNLNINVGALLPGSTPKKAQVSDENESLSTSLPNKEKPTVRTKPINIVKVSSEDLPEKKQYHSLEKSVSFDGSTDVKILHSVTKDRARIPVKRKPSSRRARQKSLRDSMSEFRLDDPIPDETVASRSDEKLETPEKEVTEFNPSEETRDLEFSNDLFKTVEKTTRIVNEASIIKTKKENTVSKVDSLFDEDKDIFDTFKIVPEEKIESKKRENDESTKIPEPEETNKIEKKWKADDLFDSSDDEDIFKTVKLKSSKDSTKIEGSVSIIGKMAETPSKKNEKTRPDSLFDFSDDDEDFLGDFSTKKTANKKNSVKNTNTLFHEEDDDDLFGERSTTGKKTKQDVKPSVINKKPPKSSSLRKLENVEGEVDPLSALFK